MASCALYAPVANAGQFSISPVRIFMQARDRAAAITVENEGDTELVMQADLYEWRQGPTGEDELTPTDDLILAPPILKLAAHAKQVVRLAQLKPIAGAGQKTYRMVVREVPEAMPQQKGATLQIALAFSLPVFITPPIARKQVECTTQRTGPSSVQVACENKGNAYAQLNILQLVDATGAVVATASPGSYLLAGTRRVLELKRTSDPVAPGRYKVMVTHDDASVQTFQADLP